VAIVLPSKIDQGWVWRVLCVVIDTELIDEICLENEKSYERINKAK